MQRIANNLSIAMWQVAFAALFPGTGLLLSGKQRASRADGFYRIRDPGTAIFHDSRPLKIRDKGNPGLAL